MARLGTCARSRVSVRLALSRMTSAFKETGVAFKTQSLSTERLWWHQLACCEWEIWEIILPFPFWQWWCHYVNTDLYNRTVFQLAHCKFYIMELTQFPGFFTGLKWSNFTTAVECRCKILLFTWTQRCPTSMQNWLWWENVSKSMLDNCLPPSWKDVCIFLCYSFKIDGEHDVVLKKECFIPPWKFLDVGPAVSEKA